MEESNREKSQPGKETHRRGFLGALAGAGACAVAGTVTQQALNMGQGMAATPAPLAEPTGSVILRMQRDLEESLAAKRPIDWHMVVDTRKCIGCDACTVACRAENPCGPAGQFRKVVQLEVRFWPQPWVIFKPSNCLQCDNAPCARAVPAGMITRRPDGIVEFNRDQLKGNYAKAAADACPVGAIHIDDGKTFTQDSPRPQEYERRSFVENGKACSRTPGANPLAGSARKCTFCSHLLDTGMLPACVTTCVGGAMYFGDANNPNSLLYEITQGRHYFEGYQNQGLKPRVIYFTESMPDTREIPCLACHESRSQQL